MFKTLIIIKKKHSFSRCVMPIESLTILLNGLTEADARIESLELIRQELGDDGMKTIGEYIKNNKHVKSVLLMDNGVTDKGVESLVPYFSGNETLRRFGISFESNLSFKSFDSFLKIIEGSRIESLYLDGSGLIMANSFGLPLLRNILKNRSTEIKLSFLYVIVQLIISLRHTKCK